MIDFHSHILPNIDDGSKSIEETVQIVKEANKAGFNKIISTSHYIENTYEEEESKRKIWVDELNLILKEKNINIEIELGNEIYITSNIITLVQNKQASTIGKKHILFELPFYDKVIGLENVIYDILEKQFVPIIAHPERYKIVQENPNIVYDWIEKGILLQANFGSIIGQYGNKARKTLQLLLTHNMIHFFGSDVHRENTIYLKMPEILKKLAQILDKEKIEELTYINAKKVLDGQEISIDTPEKIKQNIWKKFY